MLKALADAQAGRGGVRAAGADPPARRGPAGLRDGRRAGPREGAAGRPGRPGARLARVATGCTA